MRKGGVWHSPGFLGVVGLASLLFLWGVWSLPLNDPDAGMYADIAGRMVASGDWTTPRFNGLRYLEKPPLFYWLVAVVYLLFGPSEWVTHLWPALAGIGGVAVTSLIGKEAFGQQIGFLAGLILTTTIGYFIATKIVSTDLLFTFFLSLVFFAFLKAFRHQRRGWLLLFYLSLGLAVMTKGLIGIVLPLLVIGTFLILTRDLSFVKKMGLPWGVPLVLLIALPWHLIMAVQHQGFFEFYFVDNHLLRFLGQRGFVEDDVPLSFPAFLVVTFVLFSPWSFFLPAAFREVPRRLGKLTEGEKPLLFILLWGGLILLFFSLSPLRLEHYGLPAFPALALLVGRSGGALLQQPHLPFFLVIPLAVLSLSSALLWLGAFPFPQVMDLSFSADVYSRMLKAQGQPVYPALLEQLTPLVQGVGFVVFLGGGASLFFFLRRSFRMAVGCFTLMAVIVMVLAGRMITLISAYRSVKPIAATILWQAGPDDLLIHEGPLENSAGLPFYTKRQILIVDGQRGDLDFGSRFPEAEGLFLRGEELPQLWQGRRRVFFVTPLPPGQSLLRLIKPKDRHLIGQEGGRWLFSNRAN